MKGETANPGLRTGGSGDHALNHEDLGMMNIIQVVPPSSAKKLPSGVAPEKGNPIDPTTMKHAPAGGKGDPPMIMGGAGGGGRM